MLHMTIAAEQSGFARGAAIAAFIGVALLYLWVRDRRGKKRRSHRP